MPLLRRESFTHLYVIPFGNLLGLLLFCVMVAPVILIAAIASAHGYDHPPAFLKPLALLLPLASISALVIDFRWRSRQLNAGFLKRWFSPFEGGTFVIVPIWLLAAGALLLCIPALVKHLR